MAGKINVYNMGERGVNTTKSAVHLEDGELTKAENWQVDPAGEAGAVRVRDGMSKLNSSAMAGQVTGGIAIPLPDRSALTRHFFAAMDDGTSSATDAFRHSTNGTTWDTITAGSLAHPAEKNKLGTFGTDAMQSNQVRWASLNNKMYYPGNDYTDADLTSFPTIHVWDGTTDYILCEIPHHHLFSTASDEAGVTFIVPYSSSQLLVGTYDGNGATGRGRVFLLDVTTGQLTQLGPETVNTGVPNCAVVYFGRVWVAFSCGNGSQGAVRSARVDDATWQTEFTPISGRGAVSLVQFEGNLYCGQTGGQADVTAVAIISKRTASTGAWTTVYSEDGGGTARPICGPLIVNDDGTKVFAFVNSIDGSAPIVQIIESEDGASWSTSYNISTPSPDISFSGFPLLDSNGDIYWPILESDNTGIILKRTDAGTWSEVDDTGMLLRGTITSVKY